PTTAAGLEAHKRDVANAADSFRRVSKKRREHLMIVKKVTATLGFGNQKLEQELLILRAAIELKLANADKTAVFKAHSKQAEKTCTNRASEWVGTARIIAARYGCDVYVVPNYLDRWIEDETIARRTYWNKRTKTTLNYGTRNEEIDPDRELQRELQRLKADA